MSQGKRKKKNKTVSATAAGKKQTAETSRTANITSVSSAAESKADDGAVMKPHFYIGTSASAKIDSIANTGEASQQFADVMHEPGNIPGRAHFYRPYGSDEPGVSLNIPDEIPVSESVSAESVSQIEKKSPAGCDVPASALEADDASLISKDDNLRILSQLRTADIKCDVNPDKPSYFSDVLRYVLMTVCAAVMIVSAVNIVRDVRAKNESENYYDGIREMFYSDEIIYLSAGYLARESVSEPDKPLYSEAGSVYEAEQPDVLDMQEKYTRMLPNLEALKRINSSAFAWIKVQGTRVDYPVVRSPQGNNDYYLSHGLDNKYNLSGAVFTDYNNSTNLSANRNTCVYGHNMNDGTMFQTIMNFKSENQFRNGQIEIYTADGIYVYTPFSAYDAVPTDIFFHTEFDGDAEFSEFLSHIKANSMFRSDIRPKVSDKIVTLITCTNTVVDKRFVVHGVLKEIVR